MTFSNINDTERYLCQNCRSYITPRITSRYNRSEGECPLCRKRGYLNPDTRQIEIRDENTNRGRA